MNLVNIGQKLNVRDLYSEAWQRQFADPQMLAEMLREQGISFIELPVTESSNLDEILSLSAMFKREGLFVSLHPYFDKMYAPEIFSSDIEPAIERILSIAQEIGNITAVPVKCVFHGGKAEMEPWFVSLPLALSSSRRFFSWVDDSTTRRYDNVIVLCETQAALTREFTGPQRLGDTWNGILELLKDTSLGICWDFGHTFISSHSGKQHSIPDDNFIARVEHVHVHDARLTNGIIEDHVPFNDYLVPLQEYCAVLARRNYDESMLIEIGSGNYQTLEQFLDGTGNTVNKIKDFFNLSSIV